MWKQPGALKKLIVKNKKNDTYKAEHIKEGRMGKGCVNNLNEATHYGKVWRTKIEHQTSNREN